MGSPEQHFVPIHILQGEEKVFQVPPVVQGMN